MRIAITGASGLIGGHLAAFLAREGHQVFPLVRRTSRADNEIAWDPERGAIDAPRLEGLDAVVHLAGHSIAGLWTAGHRRRVRESRVRGTRLLAEALAALRAPPRVLVSGSAEGFYGERGYELLDEDSPPGTGFLSEVCLAWEAAADPARAAGVRVVHPRIGLVLARQGGALRALLRPFRLGLGGRLGDGGQYWSWIALTDLVRVLDHLIRRDDLAGPVNAVAPNPATNADFTRTLARVLRRPALLPLPAWVIRAALGGMGREMLLRSARLTPTKLTRSGFSYLYPTLEAALAAEVR